MLQLTFIAKTNVCVLNTLQYRDAHTSTASDNSANQYSLKSFKLSQNYYNDHYWILSVWDFFFLNEYAHPLLLFLNNIIWVHAFLFKQCFFFTCIFISLIDRHLTWFEG